MGEQFCPSLLSPSPVSLQGEQAGMDCSLFSNQPFLASLFPRVAADHQLTSKLSDFPLLPLPALLLLLLLPSLSPSEPESLLVQEPEVTSPEKEVEKAQENTLSPPKCPLSVATDCPILV
jgi:hypothetical protein